MDDSALTSQAIAELMREMPSQNGQAFLGPQERKINPLGRPNKRFLDRTINTALRHNKRETERAHASCQQKLLELDERHDRRMRNEFYTRNTSREYKRKSRSRKKSSRRRSRSRSNSSSDSYERRSRSRHRSHSKKKKRSKKHKKEKRKTRHRTRSRSSTFSGNEEQTKQSEESERRGYFMPPSNLALAVAMAAYNQTLSAQQTQGKVEVEEEPLPVPASPLSDIIKELMSDEDVEAERKEALSVTCSSDEVEEVLTINVSSQDENLSSSTDSDSSSESKRSTGSCIAVEDSVEEIEEPQSGSDIEIIEIESKDQTVASTQQPNSKATSANDVATTVDLTED
ncbi:serine/arginine-rich splicing factor 4 [Drosophila albomicans]|uniref:Serine/arginine-rich splicing factor 4 n=1 Tax=Drosophila albomicans TaxID=7291 RepID=A0A6P8XBX3_DROAB|nr:serine/arginine-rich splicing factor 4 [Drosophila albomicans]